MILLDVNILIHAHQRDSVDHAEIRNWLLDCRAGSEPFAAPSLVMAGFLRIVTNPRIYRQPERLEDALVFLHSLRQSERFVPVEPGPRHWEIFEDLCRSAGARGNLIADAYLAALAIESGGVWITTDRDFARFPGLQWRHPLS